MGRTPPPPPPLLLLFFQSLSFHNKSMFTATRLYTGYIDNQSVKFDKILLQRNDLLQTYFKTQSVTIKSQQ